MPTNQSPHTIPKEPLPQPPSRSNHCESRIARLRNSFPLRMNPENGTASSMSVSQRVTRHARLKLVLVSRRRLARSGGQAYIKRLHTIDTTGYTLKDVDGSLAPEVKGSRGIICDESRWECTLDCQECCDKLNAMGFEVGPPSRMDARRGF